LAVKRLVAHLALKQFHRVLVLHPPALLAKSTNTIIKTFRLAECVRWRSESPACKPPSGVRASRQGEECRMQGPRNLVAGNVSCI
jgi:hypothetical protein